MTGPKRKPRRTNPLRKMQSGSAELFEGMLQRLQGGLPHILIDMQQEGETQPGRSFRVVPNLVRVAAEVTHI